MRIVSTGERRRILDFDIENRPSTYWYADACTAEITAIAWQWIGEEDEVSVVLLGSPGYDSPADLLDAFLPAYEAADLVTGHYIRRHDLPILNAHCLEAGYRPMATKDTQDTKLDLGKTGSMSVSQDSLEGLLRLDAKKVSMSQMDWRMANRLSEEGLERTKDRVVNDILGHVAIRAELVEKGWLKPPSQWHAVAGGRVFVETS